MAESVRFEQPINDQKVNKGDLMSMLANQPAGIDELDRQVIDASNLQALTQVESGNTREPVINELGQEVISGMGLTANNADFISQSNNAQPYPNGEPLAAVALNAERQARKKHLNRLTSSGFFKAARKVFQTIKQDQNKTLTDNQTAPKNLQQYVEQQSVESVKNQVANPEITNTEAVNNLSMLQQVKRAAETLNTGRVKLGRKNIFSVVNSMVQSWRGFGQGNSPVPVAA